MSRIILVGGGVGAGKTTYSRQQASQTGALLLSIDEWMKQLFMPDQTELNYEWSIERVRRCEAVMWDLAEQQLALGCPSLFDCGFMERQQRQRFAERAAALSVPLDLHWLDVDPDLRWARVEQRNREQSASYSFEVTRQMFDFMEARMDRPGADEMPVFVQTA
ncbi:AAA family ATPase [Rhodovibrionaceae bacterium A322]